MKAFFSRTVKLISFLVRSLGPIFVILFIMLVVFTYLFAYDRFQTIKDKEIAQNLVQNLEVKTDCTSELLNPKEITEFNFTFINKNGQSLFVTDIGIDASLLGTESKTFSTLLNTDPSSETNGRAGKFVLYRFNEKIEVLPQSEKEVSVNLQTAQAVEAEAMSKTLVTYTGEFSFLIDPEIDSRADCSLNLRYP